MTGAELRSRRLALGLTMEQFGRELNPDRPVSWNTVSRWEREVLKMRHPAMVDAKLRELERLAARRARRREKAATA